MTVCVYYVLFTCLYYRIEQVAQEIVTADVFQYIITNLDTKLPYVVMVWAFTNDGDQEPARVELEPSTCAQ